MVGAIVNLLLTLPAIAAALVVASVASQRLGASPIVESGTRLALIVGLYLALLVKWRKLSPREDFGWYPRGGELARGTLLGALGAGVVFASAWLAGGFDVGAGAPSRLRLAELLLASALGVCFEEVAFRSGWMGACHRVWPKWLVIALPATAFALLHLGNEHASPLAMANSVLLSIFIAWAFLGSGASAPRLASPIGFHFGWNVMQPLLGVPVSGDDRSPWLNAVPRDTLWSGGAYGLEGSVATTALALCLLAAGRPLTTWLRGR